MEPRKQRAAASKGIITLSKKIKPLREELKKLERAHLLLYHMKLDAESQMTEVKIIPAGMTKQKMEHEEKALAKKMNDMSAEEAAELIAVLEKRLGNGNS